MDKTQEMHTQSARFNNTKLLRKEIRRLKEEEGYIFKAIAEELGISLTYVANLYNLEKYKDMWGVDPFQMKVMCPSCNSRFVFARTVRANDPVVLFNCQTCNANIALRVERYIPLDTDKYDT